MGIFETLGKGLEKIPGISHLGDVSQWVEENTGITPEMMMTVGSGVMNAMTANPVGVAADAASLYGQATGNEELEQYADMAGTAAGIGGAVKGLVKGAAKEGIKAATDVAGDLAKSGAKDAVIQSAKGLEGLAVADLGKQAMEQGGQMAAASATDFADAGLSAMGPLDTTANALRKSYQTADMMTVPMIDASSISKVDMPGQVSGSTGGGVDFVPDDGKGMKLSDAFDTAKKYAETGASLYQGYNEMQQGALQQLGMNPQAQQMLSKIRGGGGQIPGMGAGTVAQQIAQRGRR